LTLSKDSRSRAAKALDVAEEDAARARITAFGKREFQELLGQLARDFSSDAGNPGSYACTGCERCANCMFCKDCDSCYQCTHCTQCQLCNNCSHCLESKGCHACAYCVRSENCTGSAYLYLCQNLSDSNYCFGCVGLSKKDFYILNVPFPRTEYFQVFNRLKRELGLP